MKSTLLAIALAVTGLAIPMRGEPRPTDSVEIEARLERERALFEAGRDAAPRYSSERAYAHANMREPPMPAPSLAACQVTGKVFSETRHLRPTRDLVPRHLSRSFAPEPWPGMRAQNSPPATIFSEYVAEQIVQAKCANCHVAGGVSGHTRLVFVLSTEPDHESQNLAVFENFGASVDGGADTILAKIQGVAHGGGIQLPAGSAEFANMESFVRALGGLGGTGGLSPDALFDGVTMASPGRTLRQAALIFAGRVPSPEELVDVSNDSPASLRRAIRGLMEGPEFHEFLIRASNDRLLTDRLLNFDPPLAFHSHELPALANKFWDMRHTAFARGVERPWDDPEYKVWQRKLDWGIAKAPLELIAHVAENDLPYTEVLTADYSMANHETTLGYDALEAFGPPADYRDFRPVTFESYYRNDGSKIVEHRKSCCYRVLNPGNLATDYPHAGILNTNVFLRRYPSTATNRNRARSR